MIKAILLASLFTLLLLAQAGSAQDSLPKFIEGLQAKSTPSIDAMMAQLSPDFLKNYVLLHHSESLQSGSPLYPRLILFNDDASVLIGIDTNPKSGTYQTLEVQELNRSTFEYEFSRAEFDLKKVTAPAGQSFKADFYVKSCIGCHAGRPNWEAYPLWSKAYGSLHHSPPSAALTAENEKWKTFLDAQGGIARFKPLTDLAQMTSEKLSFKSGKLSILLGQINGKRVFIKAQKIMEAHPELELGIASALMGDDLKPEQFPGLDLSDANARIDILTRDTYQKNLKAIQEKLKAYTDFTGTGPNSYKLVDQWAFQFGMSQSMDLARIRYIFEDKLHLSLNFWNLDFNPASFQTQDGINGLTEILKTQTRNYLAQKYPEFSKYFQNKIETYTNEIGDSFSYEKAVIRDTSPDYLYSYDGIAKIFEKYRKTPPAVTCEAAFSSTPSTP